MWVLCGVGTRWTISIHFSFTPDHVFVEILEYVKLKKNRLHFSTF